MKNLVFKCLLGAIVYGLSLGYSVFNPDTIGVQAWEACLPEYYQASPSNASQASTLSITVTQGYGRAVEVYWIDYNGQRQFYDKLQPGQSLSQETSVGHNWVLDDGGNCEYLTAGPGFTSFEAIDESPYPDAPQPLASQNYGVTNIANAQGHYEEEYASNVRNWNVYGATVNGQFNYCVAERDADTYPLRLGYDNQQWQLGLPFPSSPNWNGQLEVDGQVRSVSGTSATGWTFVWLGLAELDLLKNGNNAIVSIGRADADFSLAGSAASILKIQECMQNQGVKPQVQTRPRQVLQGIVESDAHRMGFGCPAIGTVRSANSTQAATIEFIDQASQADGAKQVYWLDSNGTPVDIAIFDNGRARIDASVGHKFIVKNFDGTCFGGVFTVAPGHNEFIVR